MGIIGASFASVFGPFPIFFLELCVVHILFMPRGHGMGIVSDRASLMQLVENFSRTQTLVDGCSFGRGDFENHKAEKVRG